MQEKIENIQHIQYSLWGMYKDFLADKDSDKYKNRMGLFLNDCKESLRYFCRNIIITWTAVVDGLAEDFRNGRDVEEKTDCIKHIQNTLWAMYKEFLADHSVREWTRKGEALAHEYDGKKIRSFCENLLLAWTLVINGLAEEFRNGAGD